MSKLLFKSSAVFELSALGLRLDLMLFVFELSTREDEKY
jgi:hypothetical protein